MVERDGRSHESGEISIEIDLPEDEELPEIPEEIVSSDESDTIQESSVDIGDLDEESINTAIEMESRVVESMEETLPVTPEGEIYIDIDIPQQETVTAPSMSPRAVSPPAPPMVPLDRDPIPTEPSWMAFTNSEGLVDEDAAEMEGYEIDSPELVATVPVAKSPFVNIEEPTVGMSQIRMALEAINMESKSITQNYSFGIFDAEKEDLEYLAEKISQKFVNTVPGDLKLVDERVTEMTPSSLNEKVILDHAGGRIFLVQRKPKDISLFEIVKEKVIAVEDIDSYFDMLYDIISNVSFDCILIGFIEETMESKKATFFDCMNYNGKYIGDKPYSYRYQFLHKVGTLLLDDNTSIASMIFDKEPFLESKDEGVEFLVVDERHVFGTGVLLKRCKLSKA